MQENKSRQLGEAFLSHCSISPAIMSSKKVSKAKEKKLQRQQELAKIQAAKEACKKANEVPDPLALFTPFTTFDRKGLKCRLVSYTGTTLPVLLFDWAYGLLQRNMKDFYERAWGWKDDVKTEEFKNPNARFIIALDDADKPLAFSSYRFDLERQTEVLYVYEIQLEPEAQRKSLGKHMMQVMELIARKLQMKWIMCTVFKENADAFKFYVSLKYTIDEESPSRVDPDSLDADESDTYSYEIMSKKLF
eukprot:TRINITY_DN9548_c0_g1_i1.p1 TRINITY_DN9548_c0_g1~~TRINITY_DN9548_c0_g1_i1.p1  ORF type:complete len:248 (+),score=63.47 TRINITY_DN9548_c0_g1_i1:340-1083(+)